MKKIIFNCTLWGILFFATIAFSTTIETIELGTITNDVSWSAPDNGQYLGNQYRVSFTVDNDNGVDFIINMEQVPIDIWIVKGSEAKRYSTNADDSDVWAWQEHFGKGSYTLDIYGKASGYQVLSDTPPLATPIPTSLLLLGSGMLGFFSVRRFKRESFV
ncbi:MAG: hypothetical protein HQK65_15710 [Desulfamplus sp.]|nr:hypothetical protein [Desulfamplus sp.]